MPVDGKFVAAVTVRLVAPDVSEPVDVVPTARDAASKRPHVWVPATRVVPFSVFVSDWITPVVSLPVKVICGLVSPDALDT